MLSHQTRLFSYLLLLAVVPALSASQPAAAMAFELDAAPPEPVVLLLGDQLSDRQLPAFIEILPGRYLASFTLRRTCLTPSVRADSLLLFFPDTQRCELLMPGDRMTLRQRLHAITGKLPPIDLFVRLEEQAFLTLAAAWPADTLRTNLCTCPANTAPDGSVACDLQIRLAGAPIVPIDYIASDADGDPLSGTFTHQRGTDPVQNGLPAPLTSSCIADPGSLQCTITGSAPEQAGDLQLMLAVSDGAAILDLVSILEVIASDGEGIFTDRFETAVCL